MKLQTEELLNWQFWLLILLASISLVLVTINIFLAYSNQGIQVEINNRQQYINQTMKVSRINNQLIQALANLSSQTGDKDIRDLLSNQGINFNMKNSVASSAVSDVENESGGDNGADSGRKAKHASKDKKKPRNNIVK